MGWRGAVEGLVERRQTVDGRAEVGQADIAVDEEVHRAVDIAERVGGLVELAEVHFLEIIERRHDHIGNDVGDLQVELGEHRQPRCAPG